MDSAPKTLFDIARVSRGIFNTLVKHGGGKTVETFQLEKIVFVSGIIIETMSKALHLGTTGLDPRISDWLAGDEPKTCLDVLTQMEDILDSKPDGRGMMNFFQSSGDRRLASQSKSHEAIKLFIKHESYFHFLIFTEIWNGNASSTQQLQEVPQPVSLNMETGMKEDDLGQKTRVEGGTLAIPEKKNRLDKTKVDAIVAWLNTSNTNPKKAHQRTRRLRQKDTCIWLPKTNVYMEWKHMENSFLWLHGKPGAGKSVLAASVIDALEHSLQGGEVLAYFYFDFRNEQSMSALEAMRSLLSQLLQQFESHMGDPGNLVDELAKQKNEQDFANVIDFASYISRAGKCLQRQPYLVIDALDECDNVEELLDVLEELNKGGIRLFVTSRPLQEIKERFQSLSSINMDTMNYETFMDIKLHVTRQVDSHRRLRILEEHLKDDIHSMLCKKANGMFRWVQCQLNIIKQCVTSVQIREALEDLPSDLDETYDRIILKISNDQKQLKVAQHALGWLVVSLAPLKLSQIMDALSIDPIRRVWDRESAPVHGSALLDVLGSLVSHDELTDIVILSHFSVKEYLTARSNRARPSVCRIDDQDVHTQLALLCMCYIGLYLNQSSDNEVPLRKIHVTRAQLDDPGHPSRSTKHSQTSSFMLHSFHEYALWYGFHHLNYVGLQKKILHAIKAVRLAAEQHQSQWASLCSLYDLPPLKYDFELFILISCASEPLLRLYLGHSKLKPKDGSNPLIYAVYFNKIKHARTLLSRGVDLNSRGLHICGDGLLLPLEVAVEQGRSDFVDLFLANGSHVPHKLFSVVLQSHDSPFPARIVSKLLRTDEFNEWAIDVRNEELLLHAGNPARYSCRFCVQFRGGFSYHYEHPLEEDLNVIRRRLLQLNCDPSTHLSEMSLRHAVSAGLLSTVRHFLSLQIPLPRDIILDASRSMTSNTEMICLCLEMGADIHAISSAGDTPLHLALKGDRGFTTSEIVMENIRTLIDAGCNASRCNFSGKTPLHSAVKDGRHISIAEFLLPLTIPLPPDILLAASESRNPSMIQLLISKGADVHIIAANGETPFHRVLSGSLNDESENLDCIKILMDSGCDLGLTDARGDTVFNIAAENGHLSILQYLHNIRKIPLYPNILLSVPRVGRKAPIMKFLINKGADVHVTHPGGDTLLHLVMKSSGGWDEIDCLHAIRLLVDAGCDPCARNQSGKTPYHYAVPRGLTSVIEYLLSLGTGSLPADIMSVRLTGHHLKTIRFLINLGGDVHAVRKNGNTLLHDLVATYDEEIALESVKYVVRSGCAPSLSSPNAAGKTPLHVAAQRGHISVVKYLLSLGIVLPHDILLAASSGYSKKAQVIRYLISKGARVSISTRNKNTPLHLLLGKRKQRVVIESSTEDDRLECFTILIDAGCDPSAKNLAGETPLHRAAMSRKIMEYLLSQDIRFPRNILLFASTTTTLRFLLSKGLNLRRVTPAGITDLMCHVLGSPSSKDEVIEFAKTLVSDAGWDPSQKGSVGKRVMHAAAKNCSLDTIKFFLSQNVLLPSDILVSALASKISSWPWENEILDLTCFLICAGASLHATASNGDTPLHVAMKRRFSSDLSFVVSRAHWKLVEILLNHGSDPYVRNRDGKTPFDLAKEKDRFFNDNFLRLVGNVDMHNQNLLSSC